MIVNNRILLAAMWVTVILIYLVGDILRIYSGDAARIAVGQESSDFKWLFAAIFLLVPILMVSLSLVLPQPLNRGANIVVAVVFFLFVLLDIGSYPGIYDKFLLAVSMGFNIITVVLAWKGE